MLYLFISMKSFINYYIIFIDWNKVKDYLVTILLSENIKWNKKHIFMLDDKPFIEKKILERL